jgi:hypothetical protein
MRDAADPMDVVLVVDCEVKNGLKNGWNAFAQQLAQLQNDFELHPSRNSTSQSTINMAGIFSTSRLFNKTALITGASGGIGAATAILFARAGANVIISARRKDQLSKVAEEARKANKEGQTGQGGKVFELVLDVSDRRSADGGLKRSRPEGLLNMHS